MVETVGRPGHRRARRNAEEGHYYWRITQWIMPCYSMVPPYGDNALNAPRLGADRRRELLVVVLHPPSDARRCPTWSCDMMRKGGGIHVALIPGTFRPMINKDNDYMMDRAAQRRRQDLLRRRAASPCRTPRCRKAWGRSRTAAKENLVSTDNGIIVARIRLRKAGRWRRVSRKAGKPTASIRQRTRYARRRSCCRKRRASRTAAGVLTAEEGWRTLPSDGERRCNDNKRVQAGGKQHAMQSK